MLPRENREKCSEKSAKKKRELWGADGVGRWVRDQEEQGW